MLDIERTQRVRDQVGHRRWQDLSMEELASAAGLSRMTLHRRGIGKPEVGESLARLLIQEYARAVLPALTNRGLAIERLRIALSAICVVDERYLGMLDELGDRLDAVFHEPGDGEVLTLGVMTGAIERILEDGARDGTLAVIDDIPVAATLLFNATGATYRHLRSGHHWNPETATARVVDLLVAGMRP